MDYISQGKLSIAGELFRFINDEMLPGTGIEPKVFWSGLDKYAHELAKENKKLLETKGMPACVTKFKQMQNKLMWDQPNIIIGK